MEKYQIRNLRGNILDRDLTYEEALLWVDCCVGKYYGENEGQSK